MTIKEITVELIKRLEVEDGGWVDLARLGTPLAESGVSYKKQGFLKLRPFLDSFFDELEFYEKREGDKPPVYYVRTRGCTEADKPAVGESDSISAPPPNTDSLDPLRAARSYDFRKLHHLGYIKNREAVAATLQRHSGEDVNFSDVIDFIAQEAEDGKIIYWVREKDDLIKCTQPDNPNAIAKMIATPCTDKYGNRIFSYYTYNSSRESWTGIYFGTEQQVFNRINSHNIGVLQFRNWNDADSFIKKMHGSDNQRQLLPGEEWVFASYSDKGKTTYPILESYLRHYSEKLFKETNEVGHENYGKVIFSKDKRLCLFNTGLLDRFANDIYIYGDTYFVGNHFVGIRNAVTETSPRKLEGIGFDNPRPRMLKFYSKIEELVYDPSISLDFSDSEKLTHIIEDNMERFPESSQLLIRDNNLQQVLGSLKIAAEAAEKIAIRNYKYVIPQWRPQKKKVQFLMPIYLNLNYCGNPDFALVLDKTGNYYVPETVLTLSMAYTNARLLCKPDNTWLQPQNIVAIDDTDADDDIIDF